MHQISIRSVDKETAALLKRAAKQQGISLNRHVLQVLRQSVGRDPQKPGTAHDDLDHLAGTWTRKQGSSFERATAAFSEVDETLWR
jgi:hypothetical protein